MISDIQSSPQPSANKIPVHSLRVWGSLILGFAAITALSMVKDWWLTGDQPNIWFYIFVPIFDTTGIAIAMFFTARLFRENLKLLEVLAIAFSVAIIMQCLEIITKLVYYKVWAYPGWLYLVIIFPMWFLFTIYALVRFTQVRWKKALIISVLGFIGSLVIGAVFIELTGLETPGS
jgi:hypothetical protein